MQSKKTDAPYVAGHISSYCRLLRNNARYRRYWLSGSISQIGDWFNYIAIFVLLSQLTGSGKAVSWFLIAKHLAPTVFGPAAGVIADRYSRKGIMVGCDLIRAALVLGYLFVEDKSQVWLIYLLAFTQEAVWTFYSPARQASLPNLCSKEELGIANGLSGASWSVMLAVGAALGGFFTAHLGWQAAIAADSVSFLLSSSVMATVCLPHRERKTAPAAAFSIRRLTGWHDLREGFLYVRSQPKIAALLLIKSGWALAGGVLVMLAVFGEQVFGAGGEGGKSGILFSMRGVGAAVGPILAWRLIGESEKAMRQAVGAAFFLSAAAYLLFSQAPDMFWAALWVCCGHAAGSVQWVFSTTLIHRSVEDRFRGRVFSAEMAMLTLVLSLSIWLTGAAMDTGISPRRIVFGLALLYILPGLTWSWHLQNSKGS
ncbi:MFS transporter [Candidatus Electronema sp. TJ]|uniref:MFS transporter n=1 Tax=Candidatus Electronema sp. TJ TaxID=3401573 RepID=UPI003AA96DA2